MTAAFLLDTSFLITLVDDRRPWHAVERQYCDGDGDGDGNGYWMETDQ